MLVAVAQGDLTFTGIETWFRARLRRAPCSSLERVATSAAAARTYGAVATLGCRHDTLVEASLHQKQWLTLGTISDGELR